MLVCSVCWEKGVAAAAAVAVADWVHFSTKAATEVAAVRA